MKTAISVTLVYATVLIFMVILIAYVTIQINYARAFEISENMIKAIEEYEGFNPSSRQIIDNLIKNNTHTVMGGCNAKEGEMGVTGTNVETSPKTGIYNYCISRTSMTVNGVTKCYYRLNIYFSFGLPVLGDIFKFKIPGETSGIRYTTDDKFGQCK